MAVILNERDKLLQAATERLVNMPLPGNVQVPSVAGIELEVDSFIIKIPVSGPATPAFIEFRALLNGVSGVVDWSIVAGDGNLYGGNNVTKYIDVVNMYTDSVTVRASITYNSVTYQSSATIVKVRDGTSGSGTQGTRGTRYLYEIGGSYNASYGLANYKATATTVIANAVSGSTPTTPIKGDTVVFTNSVDYITILVNDGTFATTGNNSWTLPTIVHDGNMLINGSVTAQKLNVISLSAISANIGTVTAGTISGSANLSIGGTARINGQTSQEGWTNALVLNDSASSTNGVIAYSNGANSNSKAFYGISNSNGYGSFGSSFGGVGVGGQSVIGTGGEFTSGAGYAIKLVGPMLWGGWASAAPTGNSMLTLHNDGEWKDPVTTARVNSAYGVASQGVCQLIVGNTGTAVVGGGGLNFSSLIGSTQFRGTGNIVYLEGVSDRRLKTNIRREKLGLGFILKLNPVTYSKICQSRIHHGFIHDEVQKLITEPDDALACWNSNGMGSVEYESIIAPLVNAIKELNSEIQGLKARQSWLSRKMSSLRLSLCALTAKLRLLVLGQ